jgi:hypothetical protein
LPCTESNSGDFGSGVEREMRIKRHDVLTLVADRLVVEIGLERSFAEKYQRKSERN